MRAIVVRSAVLPSVHRAPLAAGGLGAALALAFSGTPAWAETEVPPAVEPPPTARPATLPGLTAELGLPAEATTARRWGWVIGASLNDGPTYSGSSTHELRVRPL